MKLYSNLVPITYTSYINRAKPSVAFCANPISQSTTPDLKQYNLPNVGEYYCGPVSATNSIIMLSQNGFPELSQGKNSTKLIEELGILFKTDRNGTTTNNLCKGLETYINSKGDRCDIKYQGFRPVDSKYIDSNIPSLDWIKSEIDKKNPVLLNLGVYKKSFENGEILYKRKYGHFVTANGYGSNGISIDKDYLTIRDPYSHQEGNHYLKAKKIETGKFIHNKDDNEQSLTNIADGFYELSPNVHYLEKDEIAIINGAISIEMKK